MSRPAIGISAVPTRRLGLQTGPPTKPVLRVSWRNARPPAHPPSADHMTGWELSSMGNDRYGVCGPVSVDMQRRLTTSIISLVEDKATQDEIFDLYRRSGNPTFDPVTGTGDDGVMMDIMGSALLAGGLGGTKPIAIAALDDIRDESLNAAIFAFGGVLLAATLQTAQQGQTDAGTWDYRRSPVWGGHAILCGSYDEVSGLNDVCTWGERVRTTKQFRSKQLDEVWLPIWPELVSSGRYFDSGIDMVRLAADYLALTGHTFPAPPTTDGRIVIDPAAKTYRFPPDWRQV